MEVFHKLLLLKVTSVLDTADSIKYCTRWSSSRGIPLGNVEDTSGSKQTMNPSMMNQRRSLRDR
ncbi:hypothetical protein DPMN_058309 [Dreissena polymorpha]|uniref:Uncharacterized protein n=1 Tax=Dreissena polymorpha TaxID=45954 RepID=A0A9D4C1V0_DREPO|nr:hypothetical protein DPMN_058309 [Dreissena polymorpha]